MSTVGSMLGMNGGAGGTGFDSPTGTNQAQLDTAYNNTQNAISTQNNFVNALAGLNGIGNQGQVYSQLAGIAAGTGPNPAQTILSNATGTNVANQAALMAGQRGSNSNVGQMARLAAKQGAATQQQAVGQGATMQANQSLNAINSMGNMANTEVANQANATQMAGNTALAQQGNLLGVQANENSANANMAGTRMGQQGSMIGNMMGAAGAAMGLAEGGEVPSVSHYDNGGVVMNPYDAAPAPITAPMPSSNGPMSSVGKYFQDMGNLNSYQSNVSSGADGMKSGMKSGEDAMKKFMQSGQPTTDLSQANSVDSSASGFGGLAGGAADAGDAGAMAGVGDMAVMAAARGGQVPRKVPALVSPGEVYLNKKEVAQVAKGKKDPMKGEKIPGTPKVKGAVNSYANDTVPKKLEEGGIVIPRSITEGPNPHWAAMKFVHATLAKNKKLPKKV